MGVKCVVLLVVGMFLAGCDGYPVLPEPEREQQQTEEETETDTGLGDEAAEGSCTVCDFGECPDEAPEGCILQAGCCAPLGADCAPIFTVMTCVPGAGA